MEGADHARPIRARSLRDTAPSHAFATAAGSSQARRPLPGPFFLPAGAERQALASLRTGGRRRAFDQGFKRAHGFGMPARIGFGGGVTVRPGVRAPFLAGAHHGGNPEPYAASHRPGNEQTRDLKSNLKGGHSSSFPFASRRAALPAHAWRAPSSAYGTNRTRLEGSPRRTRNRRPEPRECDQRTSACAGAVRIARTRRSPAPSFRRSASAFPLRRASGARGTGSAWVVSRF